ncbi:Uncharacterized protein TCM_005165 [Theobroma cacao]|uniref:Uncharacterized protein n=1 Tax=Theobroma cacao TaxID=3641 RepID=A0A061DTN6_THECC|nr:Uncharacterized protein TCM_005165 [Theobroma cacao]
MPPSHANLSGLRTVPNVHHCRSTNAKGDHLVQETLIFTQLLLYGLGICRPLVSVCVPHNMPLPLPKDTYDVTLMGKTPRDTLSLKIELYLLDFPSPHPPGSPSRLRNFQHENQSKSI